MKRLTTICVMALLWVSLPTTAQSVYERTTNYAPSTQSECYAWSAAAGELVPLEPLMNAEYESRRQSVYDQYPGPNYSVRNHIQGTTENLGGCRQHITGGSIEVWRIFSPTNEQLFQTVNLATAIYNGPLQETETCPPTTNQDASYTSNASGSIQCFDPAELALNAACDTPLVLPATSGTTGNQCHTKSDGSKCLVTAQENNGQTFMVQSLEPSTCFQGEALPYEDLTLNEPVGQDCQDVGGGVTACPENPSNVCDAQGNNCESGCGTIGFNGVEQFVCLSDDTDGDGIGDYTDADIDGDGIPNDEDPDADGDGEIDPVDPDNGGDGSGDGDGQVVGDGNTNVTVNVDGGATAEEIANELIEQTDFDTSAIDGAISSAGTQMEDALTNAFDDPNLDLVSTIDANNVESSVNEVASIFTSSQCDIVIDIPFGSGGYVDLCTYIEPMKPILAFVFAIATFWYGFMRITSTVREVNV